MKAVEGALDRAAFWAGRFYPRDPEELAVTLDSLLPTVSPVPAIGIMAPHAGYVYSGAVAADVIARVGVPDTVLILCPKHTRLGAQYSILTSGSWRFPGGALSIDEELACHLYERLPGLSVDPLAHQQEHAIEVLLPFLWRVSPSVRFVPIAMGWGDASFCEEWGQALGEALASWSSPVLMVASSDMNHFEDQETTMAKDHLALERLLALDPGGLVRVCDEHSISMCGVVPAAVMLHAGRVLSMSRATLTKHCTSADVSGDTSRVVGYAGMIFSA